MVVTSETRYWLSNEAGQTPTSTSLNHDFLSGLHPGLYLDVGCCSGRTGRELGSIGLDVIGVDLNINEMRLGRQLNGGGTNIPYVQAYGQNLPFPSSIFDGILLLGVLGAVDKNTRESILRDSIRCLKPVSVIYIAEFALIDDDSLYTSTGKKWLNVYVNDASITGEYGSVCIQNPDGSTKFVGHHFSQAELGSLLTNNDVILKECQKVEVQSAVSGHNRDTWNIWGKKII